MSAKHTLGPWIADDNEGFSPWTIWSRMTPTGSGKPGPKIAQVIGDSAETDANARLIAAAPDLLEALMEIDARLRRCAAEPISAADAYDSFYQEIVASAIAKATGSAA